MSIKIINKDCPKCGNKLTIKNKKPTFEGTLAYYKCEKCGYGITYEW